jgi:large subunit ribosomal protein L30
MSKLKITQVRSLSGRPEGHRRTVRALGLRRIHDVRVVEDSPSVRGMLFQVKHLVLVEPAEEQ